MTTTEITKRAANRWIVKRKTLAKIFRTSRIVFPLIYPESLPPLMDFVSSKPQTLKSRATTEDVTHSGSTLLDI